MQTFGSIGRAEPGMFSTLLDLVVVGLSLWILLGILKGTQGPNRFGPNPLGQTEAEADAPLLPVGGMQARIGSAPTRWARPKSRQIGT